MDKLLVRKDVYEELLEKGFGKRDLSKLTKKKVTDKNGHTRTVYVRNGEQPAEVKQPKAQEGLTPEKKARYEEMLEKVKAGSDKNALFVRGEMLNKKDAIDYLEKKLGRKNDVIAEQKMKMEDEKKNAAMKDHETKSSEQMLDEKAKANFKKDAMKMSDKGLEQKIKNLRTPGSLDSRVYSNPEEIAKVFEEELNRRKAEKNSSAEGHLESDTPQNTDITAEDEARFGKQALSGLSGKRTSSEETKNETPHGYILNKLTDEEKNKIYDLFKDADFTKQLDSKLQFRLDDKAGEMILKKMPHGALQSKIYELAREYNRENFKDARDYKNGLPEEAMGQLYKEYKQKPTQDDMKENYLDAKNEGGRDIADENRIDTHSKNAINLNDSEVKKMQKVFDYIPENATASQIMNTIYDEDKALYKKLSEMDIEYKKLHPEAEGKTFGFDLAAKYLEDSFNEYKKDHEVGKDKFAEMSVEDIRKEQQNLLDDYNQYYNAYKNGKNDGSKLREYFKKFDVYKTALDKKSKE